jgi:hypothetical protein
LATQVTNLETHGSFYTTGAKAAYRMLMKLTPSVDFISILRAAFLVLYSLSLFTDEFEFVFCWQKEE